VDIDLHEIPVRDLANGYKDNDEAGVVGYGGKLDIRPPYQREFIYKDKQRNAVIDTVTRGFPLNVMYWAVLDATGGGKYEMIDGQQRTISICQYVEGDFAFQGRYFHNLQSNEQEAILDFKLMVYLCSGTDSEKLDWFETINIAGEQLTNQELRNAVYAGSWVTDAKRYFSKNGCPAYAIGSRHLNGSPIRQDYLETAIKWMNSGDIVGYMATHQHDPAALGLWQYFQSVITWVEATFPKYRKEMKGVVWGDLYNAYGNVPQDAAKLEKRVGKLMADDDVERKKGIYSYVLDGQERHLNIRAFSDNMKREAYERQQGICTVCKKHFALEEMEADHITPWHAGGRTIAANCQMLCREDNRRKGGV
jgi:hypothetical protein